MPCSVCTHPQAAAIAAALQRGDSLRTIEAAYGVNKSSLSRHTRQCLTAVSVMPQAVHTAPAHLVNAPVHQEVQRLRDFLVTTNNVYDWRWAVMAVTSVLLQVVRDPGDDRAKGG